jgi:hypothetical protein
VVCKYPQAPDLLLLDIHQSFVSADATERHNALITRYEPSDCHPLACSGGLDTIHRVFES